ncbi:Ribosomal protein S18 acetylase RimI [Lampropedia hyalina DSM 16112]|jgi:GNAT superfamily N-acetyltransferase|uniref:Ribosomal protein S18 acetylase RimI n=1 Tax=Lampropedia hyalina DSM 16112 TaxID=1122156 RepID=A0A1M5C5D8_9BURK|nr:GNAT family N-acetyltransferase [Lampropedia hyalina]SHF49959.1 Ribosomal protein S18 acetylase RimI [Lampropedia hyalina DSM 16112]
MEAQTIDLHIARSPQDMDDARLLFEEYAQSLELDLAFQNFEHELDTLPGDYAEPSGVIYLARIDGLLAGCCALRPLFNTHYSNACEMKRLYVRKAFRGFGLGRQLSEAIVEFAHIAGYSCILLDTLNEMETARALYEELGFAEVEPYYFNPYPGARYLKADLN